MHANFAGFCVTTDHTRPSTCGVRRSRIAKGERGLTETQRYLRSRRERHNFQGQLAINEKRICLWNAKRHFTRRESEHTPARCPRHDCREPRSSFLTQPTMEHYRDKRINNCKHMNFTSVLELALEKSNCAIWLVIPWFPATSSITWSIFSSGEQWGTNVTRSAQILKTFVMLSLLANRSDQFQISLAWCLTRNLTSRHAVWRLIGFTRLTRMKDGYYQSGHLIYIFLFKGLDNF